MHLKVMLQEHLKKYRQEINSDMLFISVNLGGGMGLNNDKSDDRHQNDILISGFSDAILRYIAERGDGNQLDYIQNIDRTKNIAGEKINHPRMGGLKKRKRS